MSGFTYLKVTQIFHNACLIAARKGKVLNRIIERTRVRRNESLIELLQLVT